MTVPPRLRLATGDDAQLLSVLATQVFLETYAPRGLTAILAREALTNYSVAEYHKVLAARHVFLATVEGFAVGYTECTPQRGPLPAGPDGLMVHRLYVLKSHKRIGIGRMLLDAAARHARDQSLPCLWLTAWAENHEALRFYAAMGFVDLGRTDYIFDDQAFENRVLMKPLGED